MASHTPDNAEPTRQGVLGDDKPSVGVQPGDATLADEVSDEPVDEDDRELTPLHPNYKTMLRVGTVLAMIPLIIGALIAEAAIAENEIMPTGIVIGIAVLIAMFFIIRLPARRYFARGYDMGTDRLRVVRGIWWHSDTIVPFGRVQHIDVDQGPIERAFGIATMTLHTAGSHNASVQLPGLQQDLAKDLREEIRAHIKRESV